MKTDYLFLGDSITDSNHLWMPETGSLGDGYVAMLAKQLGPDAQIVNKGIDGFTVAALLERLNRGFLKGHPDVISLMIGINDIGVALNTDVTLNDLRFAEHYREVLMRLHDSGAAVLCSGPFIFSTSAKIPAVDSLCAGTGTDHGRYLCFAFPAICSTARLYDFSGSK